MTSSFLREVRMAVHGQYLEEKLSDTQKRMVRHWAEKAGKSGTRFSDGVFGHPNTKKLAIPLEHHDDPTIPHVGVQSHLHDHGYEIEDYKSGKAKDKYGRSVKIGKALEKTKASDDIKKAFQNDSGRAGKKIGDHEVIVSRDKYDVAGMSTNRGWKSCMNLDNRTDPEATDNTHYLPQELKNGTHVAYLVKKGDDKIENPMARIALKKYVNENGHEVMRPEEGAVYGTAGDSFAHTVRKWSEDKFPLEKKTLYHMAKGSYNDAHGGPIFSNDPETIDHISKHSDAKARAMVAMHGGKKIHELLADDPDEDVRHMVARHTDDAGVLHRMLDNPANFKNSDIMDQIGLATMVYGHDDVETRMLNHEHPAARMQVAKMTFESSRLAKLAEDSDKDVREEVAARGNHSINSKLVDDTAWQVRAQVAKHGSKAHLDKLVDDKNHMVRYNVAAHGNITHAQKLLNDPDLFVKDRARKRVEELGGKK